MSAGVRGGRGFPRKKTAGLVTRNVQITNYTLVASDAGRAVEVNSGSAITVTVPPNVFPDGSVIEIVRYGAGSVTIVQGVGVTLPNRIEAAGTTNRTVSAQMGSARLRFRGLNEALLTNDIA